MADIMNKIQRQYPRIAQYLTTTGYSGGEPSPFYNIGAMSPQMMMELAMLESGSPASMMLPSSWQAATVESPSELPWGYIEGYGSDRVPMSYLVPTAPSGMKGRKLQDWLSTAVQGEQSIIPWVQYGEGGGINEPATVANLLGFHNYLNQYLTDLKYANPQGYPEDDITRAQSYWKTIGSGDRGALSPEERALIAQVYRNSYLPRLQDDQSLQRVLGGQ